MIQLQALNKCIADNDASFFLMNNITEDFFSDYPQEYKFIKDHIDKYGTCPDRESFLANFPDFDVLNVKESSQYIIDALFEDHNKRFLAKTFNTVRDLLNAGKTSEALNYYSNNQLNVSKAVYMNTVDIIKDRTRYDAYIERTEDYNKYYITTGFPELDDAIGGWDRKEELATIIARPGVGKSFCLFKVALAAAKQGLKVGVYEGEMSENKVGYRMDTLLSHISNTKIMHGNVGVQAEYKSFLDNLSSQISGSIKVLTPAMLGKSAGVTILRAFIEKEHLDMLCVDQHSLLEDDRNAKSPVEKAANISKDLKNLQVLKKIPIIAVSQQNRESVETGVSVANIAQSDRIGQDSTVVLALEQKDGVLTMHIPKARDGAKCTKLQYAVDLDKGIFSFLPAEDSPRGEEKCEDLRREFEEIPQESTGSKVF